MDIETVRTFLADNHRGVLVARKRDGTPQMTLVTVGVDGEGRVVISSRGSTYKVKNIRRDPRVSVLVMGEQFHGSRYYQIDGTAEVIDQPEATDLLLDAYRRRLGGRLDEAEMQRRIQDEERVLIRIDIEDFGPKNRG